MRVFDIYEPVGGIAEDILHVLDAVGSDYTSAFPRSREDYKKISVRYPIFAVADGVTLEKDTSGVYPALSGAGEAARIFCEAFVAKAEELYETFNGTLMPLFQYANNEVRCYNEASGRKRETSNFWDNDLFAATAACAIIKDRTVHWLSLCDSFVAKLDTAGSVLFRSPECWPRRAEYLPKNWEAIDEKERKKTIRRVYRNGVGENGELVGYGVATGEEAACRYLNTGSCELMPHERLVLFTDGFEEYMKLAKFRSILGAWPEDIEKNVKTFANEKAEENPSGFGHERTLIAVSLE